MPETISTSLGKLIIRPTLESDFPAWIALLKEAQNWLEQRNIPQWVPGAHDPAIIEAIFRRGTGYVVEHNQQVVATCQLLESLPAFWPSDWGNVGYVSTLTVARSLAAHGIGAAVLQWAEATLRANGKRWLCLDAYANNPALCAYYEQQGYTLVGEFEAYPNYWERMYRKPLNSTLPPGVTPPA